MFENYRTFSTDLAGRKLTVETGKMAQLANGSCLGALRRYRHSRNRNRFCRTARRHRLSAAFGRF